MKNKHFFTQLLIAALSVFVIALFGCSRSSSDNGGTTTNGGTIPSNLVYTANSTTVTVPPNSSATTTIQTSNSNVPRIGFSFQPNSVNQTTEVAISEVDFNKSTALPANAPAIHIDAATNSGNVNIVAFTITTNPASGMVFNVPVAPNGSVVTSATITVGTTLNLAELQNNAWVDVLTLTVKSGGVLAHNFTSAALPGVLETGTYLLYLPAPGTSTAVSNLGIALIADDGYGSTSTCGSAGHCLQVINIYDANQAPLAAPTMNSLAYSGASDIDGQALTPDGSQGILVDGGNTVRFFSNVQTGVPIASTTTVNVAAYGGDGDSVAIMPNGDEAVVSGDSSNQLLLVSGIVSGNPKAATTITIPGSRDGVVIGNVPGKDATVLLARGSSGLTVFAIAPTSPTTGSLGGTISHSFTQTADLTTGIVMQSGEDGRDGMAISPKDPSRVVLIGLDPSSYSPAIQLIASLPNSPAVSTAVVITGATAVHSVSITSDGKTAIVGTNAGIAMFSGVDTGSLAMVGSLYAPTYTGKSGSKTLGSVPTLGLTLDSKYAVVCDSGVGAYGGSSNGSLLVIPITATGFSAPVGILNGIAVPDNDQMVIH